MGAGTPRPLAWEGGQLIIAFTLVSDFCRQPTRSDVITVEVVSSSHLAATARDQPDYPLVTIISPCHELGVLR
jgi:hypothetical protein